MTLPIRGVAVTDFEGSTKGVHQADDGIRLAEPRCLSSPDGYRHRRNEQRPWGSMSKQSRTTAERRSKQVSVQLRLEASKSWVKGKGIFAKGNPNKLKEWRGQ